MAGMMLPLRALALAAFTALGIGGGWGVAQALQGVVQPEALLTAAREPGGFHDVFSYCAAVGTVDAPDHRYHGVSPPPEVAAALADAAGSPETLRWRCMDGEVYACATGPNVACGRADHRQRPNMAVRRYCQSQPDAPSVPLGVAGPRTLYQWSCAGTQAVMARQVAHADARGFVAEFWRPLLRSSQR